MPIPLDEVVLHELVPEHGRGEVVDEHLRAAAADRGGREQMELRMMETHFGHNSQTNFCGTINLLGRVSVSWWTHLIDNPIWT